MPDRRVSPTLDGPAFVLRTSVDVLRNPTSGWLRTRVSSSAKGLTRRPILLSVRYVTNGGGEGLGHFAFSGFLPPSTSITTHSCHPIYTTHLPLSACLFLSLSPPPCFSVNLVDQSTRTLLLCLIFNTTNIVYTTLHHVSLTLFSLCVLVSVSLSPPSLPLSLSLYAPFSLSTISLSLPPFAPARQDGDHHQPVRDRGATPGGDAGQRRCHYLLDRRGLHLHVQEGGLEKDGRHPGGGRGAERRCRYGERSLLHVGVRARAFFFTLAAR